jgi:hypothetical protein
MDAERRADAEGAVVPSLICQQQLPGSIEARAGRSLDHRDVAAGMSNSPATFESKQHAGTDPSGARMQWRTDRLD